MLLVNESADSMKRIIEVEKFAVKNISKFCAWEIFNLDRLHAFLEGPRSDAFMIFVTKSGNLGTVWIIAALIMMLIEPSFKEGYTLLIALILCITVGNLIIKNIVKRNRPFFHKNYKLLIKQYLT